jgi:hypothetical protein
MSCSAPNAEIITLDRIEIAVEAGIWEFARARRQEIDRHFARLRRDRPAMWNGRVLLLNRYTVEGGVLRGACFETDYASFIAWRDWDFADKDVANIFAAAAVRGADGGYLLGEMAPSTVNAGQLYFPCGTPDPNDVGADGMKLDAEGNVYMAEKGIVIYDPAGKYRETIAIPEEPTNLCFAGPDRHRHRHA